MPDALILEMPMETSLKLMAPVSTESVDSKREFLYNVVCKFDRTFLIVLEIDLIARMRLASSTAVY